MHADPVRALLAESRRARLSLARTAKLLVDHTRDPTDEGFQPARDVDIAPSVEQTPWGPCRRLKPAAIIAGADLVWSRPASPLGIHAPSWGD